VLFGLKNDIFVISNWLYAVKFAKNINWEGNFGENVGLFVNLEGFFGRNMVQLVQNIEFLAKLGWNIRSKSLRFRWEINKNAKRV
jgi:hypothetical protein